MSIDTAQNDGQDPLKKMIYAKVAASEIYALNHKLRVCGIGLIAGSFIVAVGSAFSLTAGAVCAGLISILGGYFIFSTTQRMNYLYNTYKVGKPPTTWQQNN